KFPSGLAQPSEVTYEVITTDEAQTDGTYTENLDHGEGTTFFMAPLRVVKSVLAEDGTATGMMFSTDYQYKPLRAGADGRGPSGFASIRAIDRRPVVDVAGLGHRVTETFFAQRYPFTGMPTLVRQVVDYGVSIPSTIRSSLSETRTQYCAMELDGAAQCTRDCAIELDGTEHCNGSPIPRYPAQTPLFVHPKKITDTTFLYDGHILAHVISRAIKRTTEYSYDTEANPVTTVVKTELLDGTCGTENNPCIYHKKTITNSYENAEVRHYGKPTRIDTATESSVTSDDGITHATEFSYLHAPGPLYFQNAAITAALSLHTTDVEPGAHGPIETRTAYTYDAFGNVETTTECSSGTTLCLGPPSVEGTPDRVTRTSYNPTLYTPPPGGHAPPPTYVNGRFPVWTENAVGHREYFAYNAVFGVLAEKTGPNGIHTCFEYDL